MTDINSWDVWEEPELQDAPAVKELVIQRHGGRFDSNKFKMLVYGESGSGKTRFAATFPNALFADLDKGMASVDWEVDVADINSFEELKDLYEFLREGKHNYETIVIDTLNEMQRLALHATVEDFPAIRRSYNDLPSQSDYGKMLHDMVELTINFAYLPMRVVFISQVISRQFDTDVIQPQLIGKNTAREICRKMDVIGYIYKSEKEVEDDNRKVSEIVFDAANYVVKDRSGKLPAVIVDPSFEKLNAYWN